MDEKLKELVNNRIKDLIEELIDYKKASLNGYCPYRVYGKVDYECGESCRDCTYGFFEDMKREYEKEYLID